MHERSTPPPGGRPGPRHDGYRANRAQAAAGSPRTAPPGKKLIDFPRAGRRGWTRWIPSWKLVGGVASLGFLSLVAMFLVMYANAEVTPPAEGTRAQTTIVYYNDGETEIGRMQQENRTIVPLSDVPEHVRYAVLAAEDRSFYSNTGVSWTGTLRSAWNNSRGGELQGGSTITQQYVKNAILNNQQRTVSRKLNEFFIALKINRSMSKDDILINYLNTIYFGRNAYGVEAASQVYFNKSVSDLTVSEGAFLAGIINGPSFYDPDNGAEATDKATGRWNFVLDGMAKEGWLAETDRSQQTFPTVQPNKETAAAELGDQRRYLMQMVRYELVDRTKLYTQEELDTGGYRIVTTFDQELIKQAWRAVRTKLGSPEDWPEGTQAALASVDPTSGAVVAIYGGDGVTRSQNSVTQDTAQAGSTFKPFTLIAALEGDDSHDPVSLKSRYDGNSPLKVDGYTVRNYGNEQMGTVDLIGATEHSVNTVYVALNSEIGPSHTRDVAERAGIPSTTGGLDDNLSNVLGASSPHPIDMATAYATLASGGTYHQWYVVQQVRNANGPLYTHPTTGSPAFNTNVVADATYAMQQVVKSGTGAYARSLYNSHPLAGKTGTSDDSQSAWFVGFTPQLSTAVAMYRIDTEAPYGPLPLKGMQGFSDSGMTGGGLPVRVWTSYMTSALKGEPREELPDPVYGGVVVNPEPTVTTTTVTPTAEPTETTTRPTWTTPVPGPSTSSPSTDDPTGPITPPSDMPVIRKEGG